MPLHQLIAKLYCIDHQLQPKQDRLPDDQNLIYNHYHGVEQGANHLLVCIGDSYTKGVGLEGPGNDEQTRLDRMFGSVLSRQMHWDLLNMGCRGGSNSWSLTNMESIIEWLNRSSYQGGALIWTLTENGRDVQQSSHRKFDYVKTYASLAGSADLYDRVLADIELEWADRLINIRRQLDLRFQIICGCNFVWHNAIYSKTKNIQGISWQLDSWIEIMAQQLSIAMPKRLRISSIQALKTVDGILGINDASAFQKWYLRRADDIETLHQFFKLLFPKFFDAHDLGHPNVQGHQLWADTISKLLTSNHKGSES